MPDKTILNSPRFLAPAGYRNLYLYMHAPSDVEFEPLRRRARMNGSTTFLHRLVDEAAYASRRAGRLSTDL